jgi:hypothetical protein
MKEFKLPFESFIGGWFIPENLCDKIIDHHKNSKEKFKGTVRKDNLLVEEKSVKQSTDVYVHPFNNENPDFFKEYLKILGDCVLLYSKKYSYVNDNDSFGLIKSFNIQHYLPGEGFSKWHFERGGIASMDRTLVFMTYLNDVDDGGTEFLYQKIKTPAKKGLTLIWPTDFTHTHKGEISNTKEKYIATGWFNFLTNQQKEKFTKLN